MHPIRFDWIGFDSMQTLYFERSCGGGRYQLESRLHLLNFFKLCRCLASCGMAGTYGARDMPPYMPPPRPSRSRASPPPSPPPPWGKTSFFCTSPCCCCCCCCWEMMGGNRTVRLFCSPGPAWPAATPCVLPPAPEGPWPIPNVLLVLLVFPFRRASSSSHCKYRYIQVDV